MLRLFKRHPTKALRAAFEERRPLPCGNRHLHAERDGIYRAIARTLLAGIQRSLLLVDWSDADLRRRWLMIKAAVAVGGRAVSLYEKVQGRRGAGVGLGWQDSE